MVGSDTLQKGLDPGWSGVCMFSLYLPGITPASSSSPDNRYIWLIDDNKLTAGVKSITFSLIFSDTALQFIPTANPLSPYLGPQSMYQHVHHYKIRDVARSKIAEGNQ